VIVTRDNLRDGACNFCNKGELSPNGIIGLVYPYKEITRIEGRSVEVRICDDCLDELKEKI